MPAPRKSREQYEGINDGIYNKPFVIQHARPLKEVPRHERDRNTYYGDELRYQIDHRSKVGKIYE